MTPTELDDRRHVAGVAEDVNGHRATYHSAGRPVAQSFPSVLALVVEKVGEDGRVEVHEVVTS